MAQLHNNVNRPGFSATLPNSAYSEQEGAAEEEDIEDEEEATAEDEEIDCLSLRPLTPAQTVQRQRQNTQPSLMTRMTGIQGPEKKWTDGVIQTDTSSIMLQRQINILLVQHFSLSLLV